MKKKRNEGEFFQLMGSRFESAIAGDVEARWKLAAQVVIEFSLTFVAARYRSFFMMRKQDFKKSGAIETTRIDMEVSDTYLNENYFLVKHILVN